MAIPINPSEVLDFDQPRIQYPMFSAKHVFSTADVVGTFSGVTQGEDGGVIDFSGDSGTMSTKDGVTLYPIDSEFGFNVTDFSGAVEKEIDGLYTEGWAGDLQIDGEQAGLIISDAPTVTFKTPAVFGTWLAGLGSSTVKASTEHYVTMQQVLSDQKFPGDSSAVYQLDDDLTLLSLNPAFDEQKVADLLAGTATYEGAPVTVEDVNKDGVVDLLDLLNPNEATIEYDIAYSDDYSVTMKDDGKLLYRWGNAVKRPNDVRVEVELPLPDEWNELDKFSSLKNLYRITDAELVVHHTLSNNPNDQVRPEDFENESAIGRLPTYDVIENYNGEAGRTVWASTDDYYAGDGTLYAAGTILRDTTLAEAVEGSVPHQLGSLSEDTELGFTVAWFTTMDRAPFEPVLNEDGTEYEGGPRWRLKPEKYGQDLPSVVIPLDPSEPLPIKKDDQKYDAGKETQTVLNLLDWATDIAPLEISAGWQNNSGTVSENGLNMTENFDLIFYVKGESKPATIYSTEVLLNYEAVNLYADGTSVVGTEGSDYLVGIANNTFTGGAGADLFVLSYGTTLSDEIKASIVTDFEVGIDKLGLFGFDALAEFNVDLVEDRSLITQGVSGDDLTVSVDGDLVATLSGLAAELMVGDTVDPGEGLNIEESFLITNPSPGVDGPVDPPEDNIITGTPDGDTLSGTLGEDIISGLAGNDYLYGLAGDDVLDGGVGTDRLYGGLGEDAFVFAAGTGLDIVYDYIDGTDQIQLDGIAFADISIADYRGTGAVLVAGSDRMILRNVDETTLTVDDFFTDDAMAFV